MRALFLLLALTLGLSARASFVYNGSGGGSGGCSNCLLTDGSNQMAGYLGWLTDGTYDLGSPDSGTTMQRPGTIFTKNRIIIGSAYTALSGGGALGTTSSGDFAIAGAAGTNIFPGGGGFGYTYLLFRNNGTTLLQGSGTNSISMSATGTLSGVWNTDNQFTATSLNLSSVSPALTITDTGTGFTTFGNINFTPTSTSGGAKISWTGQPFIFFNANGSLTLGGQDAQYTGVVFGNTSGTGMELVGTGGEPIYWQNDGDSDIGTKDGGTTLKRPRDLWLSRDLYLGIQKQTGEYSNTCATTVTVDFNHGTQQVVNLTGNCTVTFSHPVAGAAYVLRFVQDATGGRTITLPTIKWPGGAGPTYSTAANKVDLVNLYSDGTNYYGSFAVGY